MVGVRLNEILPDSLFAKAQLNPGDIIISVNGVSVDTTSSDSGVLAALVEAEEWILRVRSPDGSERDVSISLRDSD